MSRDQEMKVGGEKDECRHDYTASTCTDGAVSQVDTGAINRAADWIADADGLLIAAGAGMGVDSGLPDFRGTEGFWPAYPALAAAGIRFEEIASPAMFRHQPRLAWGFYGHRLQLYRGTEPHDGFQILRDWADGKRHGAFVFTSNVDGQFQKAGFANSRIHEAHGSIHHLQCLDACCADIWRADDFDPEVDEQRCALVSAEPRCPHCGSIARPNVLMFGDYDWVATRAETQRMRLDQWSASVRRPVVIEIGAGTLIPTVRHFTESFGARYIRINTREPELRTRPGIGLSGAGLEVLLLLARIIESCDDNRPNSVVRAFPCSRFKGLAR